MGAQADVLVIGAGVSGLTTALCLAEAGLAVQVRTRRLPATTSYSSGAIWGPDLVADDRVMSWSEQTRSILTRFADLPATGVSLVHGMEATRRRLSPPSWACRLDGFRIGTPDELPAGYASGWWYSAPVIDMPIYLSYLAERLTDSGGSVELGDVHSLEEAVTQAPMVVNCAGVESSQLVVDPELIPAWGLVVVVENPGIHEFFVEYDESPTPIYYLPQGRRVVLGGSVLPGRTDLEPDPDIAEAIQQRCGQIEPSLKTAQVLEHRVGLRPSRARVRLERIGPIIHNYGHGGAGVTLSWGCAYEVVRLVRGYSA